jgi:hypothetical protein
VNRLLQNTLISAVLGAGALVPGAAYADIVAASSAGAVTAVYPLPLYGAPYSFSDLYRVTLEAPASLVESAPLPNASAQVDPLGVPVELGSRPARNAAPETAEAPVLSRWIRAEPSPGLLSGDALPRPAGWVTVLSGLAIAAFIASRRANPKD